MAAMATQVFTFASRTGRSFEVLAAQARELAGDHVASVGIPDVGPGEWLLHSAGGCACGTCGNGDKEGDDGGGPAPVAPSECTFVDCRVKPPASGLGHCYGTEDGQGLALRVIAGPGFGSDTAWPVLRWMETVYHVGVDPDGVIKPDIVEFFADAFDLSPSLANAVLIASQTLVDSPPEAVFGPSTGEFHAFYQSWRNAAAGQAQKNAVAAAFFPRCRRRALVDRALAPRAAAADLAAEWGPSEHWPDGILEPPVVTALAACRGGDGGAALRDLATEESPGVFSIPLFKASFCAAMVEELEAFDASGLPAQRPNSMNNYGHVLNRLGMGGFVEALRAAVAKPVAEALFPCAPEAAWLDSYHAFSVRYAAGEDLGLDMHTDDSEVTLNVCLGKPGFEASGLSFCGNMAEADHRVFRHRYRHVIGRCVVHLGRQRHGADDIAAGTRVNLIMWNRSLAHRRRKAAAGAYAREAGPPSVECLSLTHDRDYDAYLPVPLARVPFRRPWCPPPGREHAPPGGAGGAPGGEA